MWCKKCKIDMAKELQIGRQVLYKCPICGKVKEKDLRKQLRSLDVGCE